MVSRPTRLPALLTWGPYDDARGWIRGLLISLAGALFLGFGGAFHSQVVPIPERLVYWLVLMVLGWLWGSFVSRSIFSRAQHVNVWLRAVLAAVALSVPFSIVVALAGVLAFHAHYDVRDIPQLLGSVTLISMVTIAINILVDRHAEMTRASDTPPRFLERLPLKLRGAEVWAVEAEDHYLRLHTSKGQDLILMRLADAVAELEGIEGAQVHRSWWIARDAITGAERGDGRATLTLKDGCEVPVSRTYARVLRERGWI
jgi:DNA-binding LytR/AlgR family response regulator